ncbi:MULTISPECIES: TetR/AcrR family transcriptional regulator [unclassified Streptomyces]|uniref:TetR/AcrR family transcriptional regulator n=1 Tax=unclassified Streptomyces TaxID=2593676 RepID=UPI00226FA524|nr:MULTISPECIES: TetR/AcrR family transcriptional regulator [unclassified Streptomyces]MCY0922140.1 TetR/AcrR family transcriptional regulator [Streptomyces sp. H27-G5]MCY0960411.1 TetR/AcrR family transcriptional regulator [Streptomyces sp. H27-H5]
MSSLSTSAPGRGRPARLDRTRTVETALDLLDEHGLEALTMRRLADAVGAQAGALYRHFATKDDLLTEMAERMVASAAAGPAPADAAWQTALAGRARALRAALLARRDGARVYAGTHPTGPNTLGFAESVVSLLTGAGFGEEDAARALLAVADFTLGHTLEEQAALTPDGPADPARLREAAAGEAYPHLARALPVVTSTDFTARFEFGLDLLITGLSARGPRRDKD